jgi:phosphate transport system protein
MTIHAIREIEKLKRQILALGAIVEEQLRRAVESFQERDGEMADDVVGRDNELDTREVDIEEECLKVMALYQPVAVDLRFLVTILKINNDLERIGDLAVNIAERAKLVSSKPVLPLTIDFTDMADCVQKMLKDSLDALVNSDSRKARLICVADDEVDRMNRAFYDRIRKAIRGDSTEEGIAILIHQLSVSRFLERVADHCTNMAEDVIYMVEGRIVRHHAELIHDVPVIPR